MALKTPPLPFTCFRFSSRLASATSSPKTVMRSSRAISSESVAATISTMVFGAPCNCGCASNVGRRGIDVRRIDVYANRIDLWLFGGQRFVGRVADFADRLRLPAIRSLFGRGCLRGPGRARILKSDRGGLRLRALRGSCRVFRRRKASGNRGGLRGRERERGRDARRQY